MKTLRRHLFIIPAFLLLFAAYFYFASSGTWNIFEPTKFFGTERLYEGQAISLMYGHFSITPMDAGCEAFYVDGKVQSYFGITPAVARIVLNSLMPALQGRWTRISIFFYTFGSLVLYYYMMALFLKKYGVSLDAEKKILLLIYIICVGLGSANMFMGGRPVIQHEAISCAVFFSMASYCATILYIERRSTNYILLSCFFCLLALNARVLPAFGAVGFLLIVLANDMLSAIPTKGISSSLKNKIVNYFDISIMKQKFIRPLMFLFIIAVVFSTPFIVNYARFGHFTKVPYDNYGVYLRYPDMWNSVGHKLFWPDNVVAALSSYVLPGGFSYQAAIPWLEVKDFSPDEVSASYPGSKLSLKESTIGLSLSSPLLLLLLLAGLVVTFSPSSKWKYFRAPIISSFVGSTPVLCYIIISQRYLQDFFPFILFCCTPAVLFLMSLANKHFRLVLYPLLLLALFNIFTNGIICMDAISWYFYTSGLTRF
jgi:hypothetical protein